MASGIIMYEMQREAGQNIYPDANSTMRLTFGTVDGIKPRDAVKYDYLTTTQGILEKADPDNYEFKEEWLDEIKKASHRDFTTGFYFGKPTEEAQIYDSSSYIRGYDFVGMVLDYDKESKIATVEQRNRMFVGDEVEIFGPGRDHFTQKIENLWDEEGAAIEVAPHPQQIIKIKMDQEVDRYFLIRKNKGE